MVDIDDIIAKIKKAVRLANRTSSEGERATALRLARSLAEKNGVAFDDVAEEAGDADSLKAVVEHDDNDEVRLRNAETGFIAYILKQHFGVIFIINVRKSNKRRMSMSWVGSHLNIDIARYVYHILVRESEKAYREATIPRKVDRTTFMRGFFWAISQKLAESPLRNDLDAAIRVAERKLLEYQMENGKIKQSRNNSVNKGKIDVEALISGFSAGQGVNLARPCDNKEASPIAIGNTGTPPLQLAV